MGQITKHFTSLERNVNFAGWMAVASKFGPVILIPTFSTFPTDFLTVCGFARFFGFLWRIIASSLVLGDGKTAGSDESSVLTKKGKKLKHISDDHDYSRLLFR
jgi:hypothetical protein